MVPPYEDRQESGEVDTNDSPEGPVVDGANVGGARGVVETHSGVTSAKPEDTPGGRTASPADEATDGHDRRERADRRGDRTEVESG